MWVVLRVVLKPEALQEGARRENVVAETGIPLQVNGFCKISPLLTIDCIVNSFPTWPSFPVGPHLSQIILLFFVEIVFFCGYQNGVWGVSGEGVSLQLNLRVLYVMNGE